MTSNTAISEIRVSSFSNTMACREIRRFFFFLILIFYSQLMYQSIESSTYMNRSSVLLGESECFLWYSTRKSSLRTSLRKTEKSPHIIAVPIAFKTLWPLMPTTWCLHAPVCLHLNWRLPWHLGAQRLACDLAVVTLLHLSSWRPCTLSSPPRWSSHTLGLPCVLSYAPTMSIDLWRLAGPITCQRPVAGF